MLTGIIAVAIGLGVMVLVHEWGHFVIARLFGVRVEVFSIGFGPRLFGTRRGPTDYRLSALPLGFSRTVAALVEAGYYEEDELPPLLHQILHDTPRDLYDLGSRE